MKCQGRGCDGDSKSGSLVVENRLVTTSAPLALYGNFSAVGCRYKSTPPFTITLESQGSNSQCFDFSAYFFAFGCFSI